MRAITYLVPMLVCFYGVLHPNFAYSASNLTLTSPPGAAARIASFSPTSNIFPLDENGVAWIPRLNTLRTRYSIFSYGQRRFPGGAVTVHFSRNANIRASDPRVNQSGGTPIDALDTGETQWKYGTIQFTETGTWYYALCLFSPGSVGHNSCSESIRRRVVPRQQDFSIEKFVVVLPGKRIDGTRPVGLRKELRVRVSVLNKGWWEVPAYINIFFDRDINGSGIMQKPLYHLDDFSPDVPFVRDVARIIEPKEHRFDVRTPTAPGRFYVWACIVPTTNDLNAADNCSQRRYFDAEYGYPHGSYVIPQ